MQTKKVRFTHSKISQDIKAFDEIIYIDELKKHRNDSSESKYLTHPWQDIDRYSKDFQTIHDETESLYRYLSLTLNTYTKSDFDERFWKIILGQMPIRIIVLIKQFELLLNVELDRDINDIYYQIPQFKIAFDTVEDFFNSIETDKFFEYFIFTEVAKTYNIKPIRLDIKVSPGLKENEISFIKKVIYKIYSIAFKLYKPKVVIFEGFYSKLDLLKLSLKNKTLIFLVPNFQKPNLINNSQESSFEINNIKGNNIYQSIALKILPSSLHSNFNTYSKYVLNKLPLSPKLSLNFYTDIWINEVSRFSLAYLSSNQENSLVTFQHGGVYGTSGFSSIEPLQVFNADYFLKWGWGKRKIENTSQKPRISNIKSSDDGYLTIIDVVYPTYFYHMFPSPQSLNMPLYFDKLENIKDWLLANNIKTAFKPYNQHQWKRAYLSDKNVKIFDKNMEESLKQTKLALVSYDSTSHIELMSINFPTILYFDRDFYSEREEAKEIFSILEAQNILHRDLDSVKEFINDIDYDVSSWWYSDSTQEAKELFLKKYCGFSPSYLEDWSEIIKRLT